MAARLFSALASAIYVAALALIAGSCASPVAPKIAPELGLRNARIELINLSDCDWSVTVTPPEGREVRTLRLAARETCHLELPGGHYAITQTALSGLAGPDATRQFPVQFKPGETYRWRLATLLAAPAEVEP